MGEKGYIFSGGIGKSRDHKKKILMKSKITITLFKQILVIWSTDKMIIAQKNH